MSKQDQKAVDAAILKFVETHCAESWQQIQTVVIEMAQLMRKKPAEKRPEGSKVDPVEQAEQLLRKLSKEGIISQEGASEQFLSFVAEGLQELGEKAERIKRSERDYEKSMRNLALRQSMRPAYNERFKTLVSQVREHPSFKEFAEKLVQTHPQFDAVHIEISVSRALEAVLDEMEGAIDPTYAAVLKQVQDKPKDSWTEQVDASMPQGPRDLH